MERKVKLWRKPGCKWHLCYIYSSRSVANFALCGYSDYPYTRIAGVQEMLDDPDVCLHCKNALVRLRDRWNDNDFNARYTLEQCYEPIVRDE